MKKNFMHFTFLLFCIVCLFYIFFYHNQVAAVLLNGANLFFTRVFVSLFPMFLINDFLIALSLPYFFYLLFNNFFKKIFRTSGVCAYVFLLSLISGTPSNAYILKNLVESGTITSSEATHYLTFTYFSNPLFLTFMLSSIFPILVVTKIIIIHYASNIIIGFMIRNKAPKVSNTSIGLIPFSFSNTLTNSIKKAVSTLLMILGTIVFYMLLSFLILKIFPLGGLLKVILSGSLEITNGLHLLANLECASKIKEIISVFIISFGGLSIHTQIQAILEDTSINYSAFFRGRVMQAIISVLLIVIF